jgi:FixJ family two-component response regulator
MAIRIFKKGANDLLKKPVIPDELITAVATAVEKDYERRMKGNPKLANLALFEKLTVRERQVLVLASRGLRNGQIASRLNLSERTVETHRANGYRRLAVKNLQELEAFLETIPEEMLRLSQPEKQKSPAKS